MARHLIIEPMITTRSEPCCQTRSLDAIRLAVVLTAVTRLAADEPIAVLTRDERQAAAAEILGIAVATA